MVAGLTRARWCRHERIFYVAVAESNRKQFGANSWRINGGGACTWNGRRYRGNAIARAVLYDQRKLRICYMVMFVVRRNVKLVVQNYFVFVVACAPPTTRSGSWAVVRTLLLHTAEDRSHGHFA